MKLDCAVKKDKKGVVQTPVKTLYLCFFFSKYFHEVFVKPLAKNPLCWLFLKCFYGFSSKQFVPAFKVLSKGLQKPCKNPRVYKKKTSCGIPFVPAFIFASGTISLKEIFLEITCHGQIRTENAIWQYLNPHRENGLIY